MNRHFSKGKLRHLAGQMNKTEQRYAAFLETKKRNGELMWFGYETFKFRLADNTFYTPDFMVLTNDQVLEAHEVKGYWEPAGRIKIKVAAEHIPIRFIALKEKPKKQGGGYEIEEF